MKRVEEHEVFAAVVGMSINMERLGKIAIHNGNGVGEYADCEEYVVEKLAFMSKELMRRFRITDALLKQWERGEILFRIYLFIRNGVLIGGHIFKYKLSLERRCCDAGYETSPTQQEIRITHRVLQYLIEENA
jgi:hypothetical protein